MRGRITDERRAGGSGLKAVLGRFSKRFCTNPQGVLYLDDCGPDGGGFRCIPGFHRKLEDKGSRKPPPVLSFLLHPPLRLAHVSIERDRGCQQNSSAGVS